MYYVEGVQRLQNKPGDWNKRGGWKKSKKSINVEGGNVRGGWIFFSKSVSVTSRLLER